MGLHAPGLFFVSFSISSPVSLDSTQFFMTYKRIAIDLIILAEIWDMSSGPPDFYLLYQRCYIQDLCPGGWQQWQGLGCQWWWLFNSSGGYWLWISFK